MRERNVELVVDVLPFPKRKCSTEPTVDLKNSIKIPEHCEHRQPIEEIKNET